MLNVGIINPNWTPQRHNTDHVCVMDFAAMHKHTNALRLRFAGNQVQYLIANLNRVSDRLIKRWVAPSIPVHMPSDQYQALYSYGYPVLGLRPKGKQLPPLMTTMGYPSLNQDLALGTHYMAERANQLESVTSDSAMLHFHTDVMRELYLEQKPHEAKRCVTVPFYLPHLQPIDDETLRDKFKQEETLLVFVGSDGLRKGLAELCSALDEIASEPIAKHLRAVIVSKHAPSCRRFTAIRHEPELPRTEVQALMQQAHLFCMVPIKSESFGLVYVEAMASGCAVISDDDLPRQEILDHGRCGVLVPNKRVDVIAQALREMLQDRTRMQAMAEAGQRRARERYAPAQVAQSYAAAFQSLVG